MKKETRYEKSLRLAKKYMEETPKEEIEAALAEVEAMGIEGPTFDEYLVILQKSLEDAIKL